MERCCPGPGRFGTRDNAPWLDAELGPLAVTAPLLSEPKEYQHEFTSQICNGGDCFAGCTHYRQACPQEAGQEQPANRAEASGKLGKVVTLLRRPKGATLAELMKATGWQAHSVRGAISGAIKKKLKLAVLSEKSGDVRTYRIK
jgi:uncharacterized protein DUF3489